MEAREFIDDLIRSGLTQQAIAEKTGIPQPTLSKVLRGAVTDVLSKSYRKLQALHAELIRADGKDSDTPAEQEPAPTHEVRDAA